MKNPCLEAALSELAKVGIRDVERSYGSKHLQIRFRANGTERMYSMPSTPSYVRARINTRAGIRRMLREDVLLITAERKPPAANKPPDRFALLAQRVDKLERQVLALERDRDLKDDSEK